MYVPESQEMQEVEPSTAAYWPMPHAVHSVAVFWSASALPTGHGMQPVPSVSVVNVPRAQTALAGITVHSVAGLLSAS